MAFGLVLGGDGTVLAGFRQAGPCGIPLLAINTGHMGFLTETFTSQLPQAIACVLEGNYSVEERAMFSVRVFRDNLLLWEALSLNEMVVHREPMTSMCHFEVQIGDHAPVDIAADGVIVSTPTGSTAYALSSGGPVVTPDVPILQLVPICPHSLASRALVFSDSNPITVRAATASSLVMVVDGRRRLRDSARRSRLRREVALSSSLYSLATTRILPHSARKTGLGAATHCQAHVGRAAKLALLLPPALEPESNGYDAALTIGPKSASTRAWLRSNPSKFRRFCRTPSSSAITKTLVGPSKNSLTVGAIAARPSTNNR